jgi:hypothetical protein
MTLTYIGDGDYLRRISYLGVQEQNRTRVLPYAEAKRRVESSHRKTFHDCHKSLRLR